MTVGVDEVRPLWGLDMAGNAGALIASGALLKTQNHLTLEGPSSVGLGVGSPNVKIRPKF